MLTLRPAIADDAEAIAAIKTALTPDDPADPDTERYRIAAAPAAEVARRQLVEDGGRPAGYAVCAHTPWVEGERRYARAVLRLVPTAQDPREFDRILAEMERWCAAEGAEAVSSWAREDAAFFVDGLKRNGYRFDRLERFWELDLEAGRERLLAERERTRANARTRGIELRPLSEVRDPDRLRKMYDLEVLTEADVPHTVAWATPTYEEFVTHISRDVTPPDRVWTAWSGERVVALSYLLFPKVGHVITGYTCSHRDVRGQGIARAVKMETLGQAIELGIRSVRTANDEQNAPILHINETLGYHVVPGTAQFLKSLPSC